MAGNFNESFEITRLFFFDDSNKERSLELFNQIYGEISMYKRKVIHTDCERGHECLERDYFAEYSVYPLAVAEPAINFSGGQNIFLRHYNRHSL